jgi:hypothetical protein
LEPEIVADGLEVLLVLFDAGSFWWQHFYLVESFFMH